MASVRFETATRTFPRSARPAVDGLDLEIHDGEFLVVVGPSGCGKSTSLRMLAGLEPVDSGRVLIDGVDVSGRRARDRDVAMVFQSYALYPNMTAGENMAFALRNLGFGTEEIRSRVAEAARILQLEDLLDRRPAKMSGGQRQRVAMGRAIIREPDVFLMDEPLSNLDAALRTDLRLEIGSLTRGLGVTTVYVTHDQIEAMTLADRIAVMRDGVLEDLGTPKQVYDDPATAFVASFLGATQINLLTAVVRRAHEGVLLDLGPQRLLVPWSDPRAKPLIGHHESPITVGIRVDALAPVEEPRAGAYLAGRVVALEYHGHAWAAHVDAGVTSAEFPVLTRRQKVASSRQGLLGRLFRPRADEATLADHVGIHRRSDVLVDMPAGAGWKRGTPLRLSVDLRSALFFGADGRRIDQLRR
jgi:multiple sugar transport system ATP-binding protein